MQGIYDMRVWYVSADKKEGVRAQVRNRLEEHRFEMMCLDIFAESHAKSAKRISKKE